MSSVAYVGEAPGDLLVFERPLVARGEIVAGIDEVGRGALAGPLVVGALVVATDDAPPLGLNDSKLLTPRRRSALTEPLRAWAMDWSLGTVSSAEIDAWGLRYALAVAGARALEKLRVEPTHVLVDGPINFLRVLRAPTIGGEFVAANFVHDVAVTTLVRGDRRSATIAGASVLAKVARDAHMVELDHEYAQYHWARNKGYGSPEHLAAIRCFGLSVHHRSSWNLPRQHDNAPRSLE